MELLIKNARVTDYTEKLDLNGDIYIKDGLIREIGANIAADCETLDAHGMCAAAALCDMHVHFRDPGLTYKEDIRSGCAAALAGGFTSVACMPNTVPCVDSPETVKYIIEEARNTHVRVFPIAAVSVGQKGEKLTDFAALRDAGAVAFSDDGRPVSNAALCRDALREADRLGVPVISHCEILELATGAVNEGEISKKLGIRGSCTEAESLAVLRDAALSLSLGVPVHIAHVSCRQSVDYLRQFKALGARVTAETCPHYFALTEDAILTYGANAKMNPPLRTSDDRDAIIEGLSDGTIDVIATDHAPHAAYEKEKGLIAAPSGIVGLETALALTVTYLSGIIPLSRLLYMMSKAPLNVLRRRGGTLKVGERADIVLFDPSKKFKTDTSVFKSKSANCPYDGMELYGKPEITISGGKIVCQ